MSRTDPGYQWKLLRIRDAAIDHMKMRGEIGVVITTRDDGLQVLTHEEAARYLKKRFYQGVRGMSWSVGMASLVDRSCLTDDTRKAHDDFVIKASWRLQQMRKRPPQIGGQKEIH